MLLSDATGLTRGSEKRVQVQCELCGVISETTYANYFKSQEKRDWPKTTYCRSCVCKLSADKRRGKPAHNKGKPLPESQKGENHPSWKGGRFISSDGYTMVRVGGKGWNGYRKEHIILVEGMLGRPLSKTEIIHHIDGQKQNNDPENLWVTDFVGHKHAHQSLQEIGYDLIKRGLITFDRETGEYKWKTSM